MAHASHPSPEAPPADASTLSWDDWGEVWVAPDETLRLSSDDTPQEWVRRLRHDHVLLLCGEYGVGARACVHLMLEHLVAGRSTLARAQLELRTWRYEPEPEGEKEKEATAAEGRVDVASNTSEPRPAKDAPAKGSAEGAIGAAGSDTDPSEKAADSEQVNGPTGQEGEASVLSVPHVPLRDEGPIVLREKNQPAPTLPNMELPPGAGLGAGASDRWSSRRDARSAIPSLRDLMRRARRQGCGAMVFVLDLSDAESELLTSLFEDAPTFSEARHWLSELNVYLVVIVGPLPGQSRQDAAERRRRRATLQRDLMESQRRLILHQTEMQAQIRQVLPRFLNGLLTKDEARRSLKNYHSDNLVDEVAWEKDQTTVMTELVEALLRRGQIERMATWLEEERPSQIPAIQAIFSTLSITWTELVQSIQDIKEKLGQLDADADQPASHAPELRMTAAGALKLNLIHRVVEGRVFNRQLRRTLMAQVDQAWWGATEEEVVTRVLSFEDSLALEEEIRRLEENRDIDLGLLQRHGVLARLVLFLASFVDSLSPRDFSAVIEFLLERELETQARDGDEDQTEPERRWELRTWRVDADQVMEECGLHVVRPQVGDRREGPRVKWRTPRDGTRWYERLSSRCHMFVERQLLHLQHSRFLVSGDALLKTLGSALVHEASRNPDVLAREWLRFYLDQLKPNEQQAVNKRDAKWAEVSEFIDLLFGISRSPRLGWILWEMQGYRELRDPVRRFLQDLIATPGPARARCVVLLRELRGAPEFDDLDWLVKLYMNGGPEARGSVTELFIRYCRTREGRLNAITSAALQTRAAEGPIRLDQLSETLLVMDVALAVAGQRDLQPTRLALDLHPWTQVLVAPSTSETDPVPWILHLLVRPEGLQRALATGPGALPTLVTSALTPTRGPDWFRGKVAHGLGSRWWAELSTRMGPRFAWYSSGMWPALEGLYAAQVLVDWMLSLPPAENGTPGPSESALAQHLARAAQKITPSVGEVWKFHWQAMYRALKEARVILAESAQSPPEEQGSRASREDLEAAYQELSARCDAVQRLSLYCDGTATPMKEHTHAD